MDSALAEGNYDTVIVHVGINGIINDDSSTKIENLLFKFGKNCDKVEKIWN